MTSRLALAFDPFLPWPVLAGLALVAIVLCALLIRAGKRGGLVRLAASLLLILALADPRLVNEEREGLPEVVALVVDRTGSQTIDNRAAVTDTVARAMEERIRARPNTILRTVEVFEREADGDGTHLFEAFGGALADVPAERLAGIIAVTDGVVHDVPSSLRARGVHAPFHALITGRTGEFDRRIEIVEAPRFGIVGKDQVIRLRVVDKNGSSRAGLTIRRDGEIVARRDVATGQIVQVPIRIDRGGPNVVEIEAAPLDNELTLANNRAVITIEGVRDKLRVLLVSGEPHAGERTWRNLLKADPAVDLVHFTILRPPEKQDGTPIEELSLIAFPTRELFEEKIDQFDLIVFDRYQRMGVLPPDYYENIARYVEDGGALLVASGPDYASPFTIYDSALGDIMPAAPTGLVTEQAFRPHVTAAGERHPVTAGLPGSNAGDEEAKWGRWMRVADAYPIKGEIVMEGPEKKPLLMLNRVGEGRVALLLSDHAWLWARGYDGGGPQAELLRRLAHWLMKEPDLEEEKLSAEIAGGRLKIVRRAMGESAGPVTITRPDGSTETVPLAETAPGRFEAGIAAEAIGLYRIQDGALTAIAASGALNPREFQDVRATPDLMTPAAEASGGRVAWIDDGVPGVRRVREGRSAGGVGWIGLIDRQNYATLSVSRTQLLDPLLAVVLALGLWMLAWRREGR